MKTTFCVLLLFSVVLAICGAQSSNDDQRLVGTWVVVKDFHPKSINTTEGRVWVFTSNNILSVEGRSSGLSVWGTTSISGYIIFVGTLGEDVGDSFPYFITPDGRWLFISGVAVFQKR